MSFGITFNQSFRSSDLQILTEVILFFNRCAQDHSCALISYSEKKIHVMTCGSD